MCDCAGVDAGWCARMCACETSRVCELACACVLNLVCVCAWETSCVHVCVGVKLRVRACMCERVCVHHCTCVQPCCPWHVLLVSGLPCRVVVETAPRRHDATVRRLSDGVIWWRRAESGHHDGDESSASHPGRHPVHTDTTNR